MLCEFGERGVLPVALTVANGAALALAPYRRTRGVAASEHLRATVAAPNTYGCSLPAHMVAGAALARLDLGANKFAPNPNPNPNLRQTDRQTDRQRNARPKPRTTIVVVWRTD